MLPCSWDFPGKNTEEGCHFLLQGIFPSQGLNPHLQYWQEYFFFFLTTEKPPGKPHVYMCTCIQIDPWTMWGLGVMTLHAAKSPHLIYIWLSILYPHYLFINSSASADSTKWGWYGSIVVFTMKKTPCISGPLQFKPMLLKGQLYIYTHVYMCMYTY